MLDEETSFALVRFGDMLGMLHETDLDLVKEYYESKVADSDPQVSAMARSALGVVAHARTLKGNTSDFLAHSVAVILDRIKKGRV